MVHLERLITYANDLETNTLAFEVYMRRKKYLLALKCLVRLSTLDPSYPIDEFISRLTTEVSKESLPSLVNEVISLELEGLRK